MRSEWLWGPRVGQVVAIWLSWLVLPDISLSFGLWLWERWVSWGIRVSLLCLIVSVAVACRSLEVWGVPAARLLLLLLSWLLPWVLGRPLLRCRRGAALCLG